MPKGAPIRECPANKSDIRSLRYVVDNCFRKIFDIKLKETVEECMREFNVSTVNDVIDARKRKFLANTAYLKTHYAKCLHVWVGLIYDNCAHYVTHLHCTVRYLLLS